MLNFNRKRIHMKTKKNSKQNHIKYKSYHVSTLQKNKNSHNYKKITVDNLTEQTRMQRSIHQKPLQSNQQLNSKTNCNNLAYPMKR